MIFRAFTIAAVLALGSLSLSAAQIAEMLSKARELMTVNQYPEAEAALREALSEEPENPEANQLLGLCLLELKRYPEAEQAFLKAEKALPGQSEPPADPPRSPRPEEVQIGLARALMEQKELDRAAEALARAEQLNPQNADLYFYRGIYDAHRQDYAAAAADMDKAIELNPEKAYAYYYSGIAYNQIRKPDKMVQRFQMFLKLAPEAPEAAKVKTLLRAVR